MLMVGQTIRRERETKKPGINMHYFTPKKGEKLKKPKNKNKNRRAAATAMSANKTETCIEIKNIS